MYCRSVADAFSTHARATALSTREDSSGCCGLGNVARTDHNCDRSDALRCSSGTTRRPHEVPSSDRLFRLQLAPQNRKLGVVVLFKQAFEVAALQDT